MMTPDSDPENTPTGPRLSEFEQLAVDLRDVKILCERVDSRSLKILQDHQQWATAIESIARRVTTIEATRVIYPTTLSLIAILLAGLALVR